MAERVAVVGAGQMGNGIAHEFAQSGYDVTLIDVSADALKRGTDTIGGNLDRQIKKGTIQQTDKDAILGRIKTATSSAEGVKDASLIIEAATENVEPSLAAHSAHTHGSIHVDHSHSATPCAAYCAIAPAPKTFVVSVTAMRCARTGENKLSI